MPKLPAWQHPNMLLRLSWLPPADHMSECLGHCILLVHPIASTVLATCKLIYQTQTLCVYQPSCAIVRSHWDCVGGIQTWSSIALFKYGSGHIEFMHVAETQCGRYHTVASRALRFLYLLHHCPELHVLLEMCQAVWCGSWRRSMLGFEGLYGIKVTPWHRRHR